MPPRGPSWNKDNIRPRNKPKKRIEPSHSLADLMPVSPLEGAEQQPGPRCDVLPPASETEQVEELRREFDEWVREYEDRISLGVNPS